MKKKSAKPAKNKNFCYTCNKTIIGNSFKFKSHLYTHNKVNARFACSFCLKEFYRNDAYTRHLEAHKENVKVAKKLYICDVCNRSFSNKCNMIKHFRMHDVSYRPERFQFLCKVCGIEYCEDRLLVRHIRNTHFNFQAKESSHEKKMPNETWVEKVMKTDIYVEMTKLTENVIAIKRCRQIKNEKDELKEKKNGVNVDKKLYLNNKNDCYSKAVCNYCNKEMLKKSLLNHIREKHLETKKFRCDTCNANFNRRYRWVNHICGRYKPKPRKAILPL